MSLIFVAASVTPTCARLPFGGRNSWPKTVAVIAHDLRARALPISRPKAARNRVVASGKRAIGDRTSESGYCCREISRVDIGRDIGGFSVAGSAD
jgi:hypothetical protein